jgi:hypothetical protein
MLHSVPSSEVLKNPDHYFDHSLSEPIFISRNGRTRLVMMSIEDYRRMIRRSRTAILTGDLGDADLSAIGDSKIPAEFEKHNHEMTEHAP